MRLRVLGDADLLTIQVRGTLDSPIVKSIAAVLGASDGTRRIEIDLSKVEGHTEDGVAALALLRSCLVSDLERAVTYRARSGAGRAALLAADALSH